MEKEPDQIRIDGYDLPPSTRVCNCYECDVLLLAVRQPNWGELSRVKCLPSTVNSWVTKRPYCAHCITCNRRPDGTRPSAHIPPTGGTLADKWMESGSSLDDGVKAIEDNWPTAE